MDQRKKPVTVVAKQAISQINAVVGMHTVMLAPRKGILLRCASLHIRGSLLRRRYVKSLVGRNKKNRVHGRYSHDPVYGHMLINGKRLSMDLDTGAEVSIMS